MSLNTNQPVIVFYFKPSYNSFHTSKPSCNLNFNIVPGQYCIVTVIGETVWFRMMGGRGESSEWTRNIRGYISSSSRRGEPPCYVGFIVRLLANGASQVNEPTISVRTNIQANLAPAIFTRAAQHDSNM